MAIQGELGHGGSTCDDCGIKVEVRVCSSSAGYYLGTMCQCGPYSREGEYYSTRGEAQADLDDNQVDWRNY